MKSRRNFPKKEKNEEFLFVDSLGEAVQQKNKPFISKQRSCWQLHDLLNQLQGTLDHSEVRDTWFDNLSLVTDAGRKDTRRGAFSSQKEEPKKFKLRLSGRYLVRATEEELLEDETEKRNTLIDLNSRKQEALTSYLEGISVVSKIDRKVFSIEGKGDLFGKYFTHFEYLITTSL